MKRSKKRLTWTPDILERKIREMNINHRNLLDLFSHFKTQSLDLPKTELDKLTQAIEEQIELVRSTEEEIGQRGKEPRRTRKRGKTLGPKNDSTVAMRTKLAIKEQEVEAQVQLCKQEEACLLYTSDAADE